MEDQQTYQKIKDKLSNRKWRLNNLYYIKNKAGKKVLFRMNWAQHVFYATLWYFNIVLKARQLGFSTFIVVYMLDACLFNSHHRCGIIDYALPEAIKKLEKAKFAYNHLPEWLKEKREPTKWGAQEIEFNNGSGMVASTSHRGDTLQKLHISEFGKIAARFPEKAKDIKTGALNAVETGQQIFIESTAEGKAGEFFDLCEIARKLKDLGRKLTRAEPKFFFFAWFDNPENRLNDEETVLTPIPDYLRDYFKSLPPLDDNQKAWYAAKHSIMGTDMKREHPSTAAEAFEGSLEGAYYTQQMAQLRKKGRITRVPYNPSYPVFTEWDLGLNDMMSIWFSQLINGEKYYIDYHESSNEGWEFYAKLLTEKGYVFVGHLFPHDGNKRIRGAKVTTDKQMAEELGIRPIIVVGVTPSVDTDIRNYCKPTLPLCYFDEEKCAIGINHLDNYRRKWNAQQGMFTQEALHDEASHGADGFRTGAVALKKGLMNTNKPVSMENKSPGLRTMNKFENPTNPSRLRSRR